MAGSFVFLFFTAIIGWHYPAILQLKGWVMLILLAGLWTLFARGWVRKLVREGNPELMMQGT